jgi:hypothetical protein
VDHIATIFGLERAEQNTSMKVGGNPISVCGFVVEVLKRSFAHKKPH